ncbi:exocyst complex component Sec10-like protein [Radiomyces spectabilis]|uniref:exocyst complex component Sec10-like protein n=1 Tax=Radiomyces spectabilis TaxID=64574 RepID=UPI00221E600D|nr:exocyst complex component Sec10-like protein [Radiomyces spectabilis]KAI8388105.1 exocyst complex component Sec10-like protein [Radiomyces spectabilis]
MNPTPKANLFELNPNIKRLLTIDTFKGNVSTTEFVEQISSNVIQQMKDYSGQAAFDPKPFIRTFENVLDELKQLRTRVQQQCDELEANTQKADLQYKKNITELQDSFEDVYRSYDALENRLGDVGKTAIRIGEQLETIDNQRSRASESRDIIEYFMEFQDGSSERLDMLRYQSGDEGQFKAAIIGRRLNAVAKEMDTNMRARVAIEKFCESFEKEMLEEFDKAYKEGDPRVMAHCAKVLFEFNGGASCVKMYVNQHEFFMSNLKIEEMDHIRQSEDHSDLSDPNMAPPEVDTSLVKLYDDIRITARREAEIISDVFPQPAMVMQVFLQRTFAQSIQNHIELLLSRAERYSHLAYLRTLASTHAETKRLVENLKFYYDKEMKLTNTKEIKGLVITASPDEVLDRCMEDLFVPYTEGDRYLNREKISLNELFGSIVAEFLSYMQQRKKTSMKNQSVLTRTLNQISASSSSGMLSASSSLQNVNEAGKMSPASTNPFHTDSPHHETAVAPRVNLVRVDEGGFCLLSKDALMRLFTIHVEAILRCVELTETQELPASIQVLFALLMDFIGTKYLDIVLDDVLEELSSRSEPEMICFPVIKASIEIMQLVQEHFRTAIIPLIINAPSYHRDILNQKNALLSALEDKINGVLQKSITSISDWLNELLAKQKKNDFRPRDEEVVMMSAGTTPCMLCVEFITKVYRSARETLQGKNLENLLLRIGNNFYSMLLDHFKKFYVTPTGGLLMTKDIAKYQEVIRMFNIPALNDRFEMLRQLGNIFLVKPEILRSILSEGYLARLGSDVLLPYLEKRVDFKSAKLDRMLGITVDSSGAVGSPARPENASGRSQRRSLFVNDNTVLREMMSHYNNNRDFLSAFNLA